MFAVPVSPLSTSTDGTDVGQHAVSSELSPLLHDDNAPQTSSVATPASSTVTLDKAALGAIPPAFPVHQDSVVRQMGLDSQAHSAVSHSASRDAGTNSAQVPVVPAAPPLLPSPSQMALPPRLPWALIWSRTRCRRAAAAGKPQANVHYDFDRSDLTPTVHDQPPPRENRARLGAPRLLRFLPGPPWAQFLLC